MSSNARRREREAREVSAKLKAEGRAEDAEKVHAVCRSLLTALTALSQLHTENMALRGRTEAEESRALFSAQDGGPHG